MLIKPRTVLTKQQKDREMTEEVWLARKIEAWYRACYNAAWAAGGNPDSILENIPKEVIITLARNNIHFVYQGKDNEQ